MPVHAELVLQEKMQFVARAEKGSAVVMDNPEGASGPTPMQMVLMGVAGCTAMDVVSILRKKRAPFTGLRVRIEGDQAPDHPRRYTHFRIEFIVHGENVRAADVERAIELSVTRYCSAIASMDAELEHTYRIVA
jgi:putative redox protein